jgi:hypothetical protein
MVALLHQDPMPPPTTPRTPNAPNALKTNGFSPDIWGPGMWQAMHMIAATMPEHPTPEQSRHYYTFFSSLANVLPCPGCRAHYSEMIGPGGILPLTTRVVSSRINLFKWTVAVHDAVNARVGKPHGTRWQTWYRHYDSAR